MTLHPLSVHEGQLHSKFPEGGRDQPKTQSVSRVLCEDKCGSGSRTLPGPVIANAVVFSGTGGVGNKKSTIESTETSWASIRSLYTYGISVNAARQAGSVHYLRADESALALLLGSTYLMWRSIGGDRRRSSSSGDGVAAAEVGCDREWSRQWK